MLRKRGKHSLRLFAAFQFLSSESYNAGELKMYFSNHTVSSSVKHATVARAAALLVSHCRPAPFLPAALLVSEFSFAQGLLDPGFFFTIIKKAVHYTSEKCLESLGRLSAENARVSEIPHLDLLPFLRLVWKSGVETQRNRNGVLWPG